MTVPFYCVFAAALLIYLSKVPVAIAMKRLGKYDNRNAREQQARLSGWGKRALYAHNNAFESFPIFAAAVIIAHLKNADPSLSAYASLTYVFSRVFYTAAYIGDRPTARSTFWLVGMLAVFALFLI